MNVRPRLFVLDTSVVSEMSKPSPDPKVVAWLADAPAGTLCIPGSVVFEIQLGVELARRRGNTRADEFEGCLDAILGNPRFSILRPSIRAERIRAVMAADPELRRFEEPDARSSRMIAREKLSIAATAVAAGAVIVSMNKRDFAVIDRHFPLPGIFHPASGERWELSARDTSPLSRKATAYRVRRLIERDRGGIGLSHLKKELPDGSLAPIGFARRRLPNGREIVASMVRATNTAVVADPTS